MIIAMGGANASLPAKEWQTLEYSNKLRNSLNRALVAIEESRFSKIRLNQSSYFKI